MFFLTRVNPEYPSAPYGHILHVIRNLTTTSEKNVIVWHALDARSRQRATRAETAEFTGWRVPLFESAASHCAPNAKIIEQDPGCRIPPHFHTCHQFQVVTAGSGLLGRTPVRPLTVHYTSEETGYGPIEAGAQGLSYYVLRPQRDPGARFMPGARDEMRPGLPRHHAVSAPVDVRSERDLLELAAPVVDECLPASPQGMAVWRVALPPGGFLGDGQLPGAGSRFYLVTAGAVQAREGALSTGSVGFTDRAEPLTLQAAPAGAEVLVLQFPPEATLTL